MTDTNSIDFSSLVTVLRNVTSRNYHGIVRVYVDFPGQTLSLSVPDFLYNRLTDIRTEFWQVGFLDHYDEWHASPNTTYFSSTSYNNQIIAVFSSSFTKTKMQLRYFAVTGNYNPTRLNVGSHDNSFYQDTYGVS
ncbi:unnamed protein product [Adineta steineri]|uniref:Uncharacterized protein n=1 Tax=Adineta steineri TaxID=433720 RepID=A0A813S0T5_9BILA|nr:unnamed protein product [Adineta steineri]CAF0824262.1 unnamed protein product [Adineta steineri]CAF1108223.1 unnamed protein product [Adineta steineri]CAF1377169.1 unnamed protein product [Adineta steineri]CAF1379096.1 unnamed protein product [Adineta steineri]